MEFRPSILGVEAPMDRGSGGVSLPLQGLNFSAEGSLIGDTPPQARSGQDAELDLRHVEPTAVFGGVVELQPLYDTPGLRGRKGLVQGSRAMSVQVIQNNSHHRGLRVGLIHQPTHLTGEVLLGPPLGDGHVSPALQRLAGQEQVPGALPSVLVVLSPRLSRLRWEGGRGSLNS